MAKTILITDVDDTLKDSRVRNRWEMLKRGPRTGPEMLIPGVVEALHQIVSLRQVQSVFYVSKIPSFLDAFHEEFLTRHAFPDGELYSRSWQKDFKFRTIREIIYREQAMHVVLIGDNGESDPQVFYRLQQYFARQGVTFEVRIRRAYHSDYSLEPGQQAFTDGNDLLASLHEKPSSLAHWPSKAKALFSFCRLALRRAIAKY